MSWVEAVFVLLGVLAVGSAVLVVTTTNLVHAALWLVVTLGAIAGVYLILAAEFVAWVQVLIYVGAVVVLLLFGLMLTRAPIGLSLDLDGPPLQRAAAAVVAVGLAAVVCVAAAQAFHGEQIELGDDAGRGSSTSTGTAVFRAWVLPFEVLSVLLLASLVGSIVLSRSDIGPASSGPGASGPGEGEEG